MSSGKWWGSEWRGCPWLLQAEFFPVEASRAVGRKSIQPYSLPPTWQHGEEQGQRQNELSPQEIWGVIPCFSACKLFLLHCPAAWEDCLGTWSEIWPVSEPNTQRALWVNLTCWLCLGHEAGCCFSLSGTKVMFVGSKDGSHTAYI